MELINNGKIVFNTGAVVQHNKRRIHRLTLTANDFMGLHDYHVIHKTFSLILNSNLSVNRNLTDRELKAYTEFNQYITDIRDMVKGHFIINKLIDRTLIFRTISLPLHFFLLLIDEYATSDELIKSIQGIQHTNTGVQNRLIEYILMKPIRK